MSRWAGPAEGWTVAKAVALLRELKENLRTGKRPQSLREMRSMAEEQKQRETQLARRAQIADLTFRELAEHYTMWSQAHRASHTKVVQLLATHILPILGDRLAREITPQDVADLGRVVAAKRPLSGRNKNNPAAGLSPQTVLHILKTVRGGLQLRIGDASPRRSRHHAVQRRESGDFEPPQSRYHAPQNGQPPTPRPERYRDHGAA